MRRIVPVVCAFALAACASVPLPPPPDAFPDRGMSSGAASPRADADARAATRVGLAFVESLAQEENPDIAAALAAYEASGGREEQAGLWPNPSLRFEARDVPRHPIAIDRGGQWVEVTQPFAPGGRIAAAVGAAAADREALGWTLAAVRRRVAADVRSACADLAAANEAHRLRASIAGEADGLAAAARRRLDQGLSSDADATLLAIEAERAASEFRRSGRVVTNARSALGALVGGSLPAVEDVVWSAAGVATSPADADSHPAIRAAAARVAAAERRMDEARAARVPDVAVSVAYGRVGEDGAEFVEAAVEVPLPVFDRNQGRIREADALVRAARAEVWTARRDVARRRESALVERAAAAADVEAHRERIVPAVARLAEQMLRGYESGARSATELALARRAAAEARLGLVEAERALRRAEAELLDVVGGVPTEVAQ